MSTVIHQENPPTEPTQLWAFVDESERDETHYFMSAIVGTLPQLEALGSALEKAVRKHASSTVVFEEGFEIHAYEIMNHFNDWNKVPLRLRFKIMEDVYTAIGQSDVTIFIECIRIEELKRRAYREPLPPREIALQWLLEKVNNFAKEHGEKVTVYADNHHTAPEANTKLREYAVYGTIGYKSTMLTEITQPLLFVDSKKYRQLQAADACTYLYNRWVTVKETDPRADAMKKKWYRLWQYRIRTQHIWP